MVPLNPYKAGNPIKEQIGFFGRQDVFKKVMEVLRQPSSNSIVLYGQRRIGKTTVLLQLQQQLSKDDIYTPVYFDLQDKAAKSLAYVLYELAQNIAKVTNLSAPDLGNFDKDGIYFRKTFLPNAARNAKGDSLVLLFDEFDVLDSPVSGRAGLDFFPYLRAWMANVEGVQFVFVIGRRPEDLSTDTLSTFKAIQATRVSLLDRKDTESVIRQSETEKSLIWTKEAVDQIWNWTHGHPFFTQLLCSVIWENTQEESLKRAPQAQTKDVDEGIDEALKSGTHAFQWIWDGLPPAERVVTAALAEAREDLISQDEMVEILRRSGVRLIVRELELAPETLVEWEVLEQFNGGYRFMVPLLRRWVGRNRPLKRVKEELDRLDPIAEDHYKLGRRYHNLKEYDQAEAQLRQALRINPNHLKSRLLYGRSLMETGRISEAVDILDVAYQYDPGSTRAYYVQALLANAEDQDEEVQLSTYERILEIDSDQTIAKERVQTIWSHRGEQALKKGLLEESYEYFNKARDQKNIAKLQKLIIEGEVKKYENEAIRYEKDENWSAAIDIYEKILKRVPVSIKDWQARLENAKNQSWLKQRYNEAVGALSTGDTQSAQRLFADVINRQPDYKDASRLLTKAITGLDVKDLQEQPSSEKKIQVVDELPDWLSMIEHRINQGAEEIPDWLSDTESAGKQGADVDIVEQLANDEKPELVPISFEHEDTTDPSTVTMNKSFPRRISAWLFIPLGFILTILTFSSVSIYVVDLIGGGALESGIIVLLLCAGIGAIAGSLSGFGIGLLVGLVVGGLNGYLAYIFTGNLRADIFATGFWSVAAGFITSLVAVILVISFTYGLERLINKKWRQALNAQHRLIEEALQKRGFIQENSYYYSKEFPLRVFIYAENMSIQEQANKGSDWETVRYVNVFHNMDYGLTYLDEYNLNK